MPDYEKDNGADKRRDNPLCLPIIGGQGVPGKQSEKTNFIKNINMN